MSAPTTPPASIRTRVEAGAAWLDQHRPGWLDEIDLITLDVGDRDYCVMGQLYGDADWPDALASQLDAIAHGLLAATTTIGGRSLSGSERFAEYQVLTESWRDLIERRITAEAARVAAACCPCRGVICDPGCTCRDCPHSETELTDDDD